MHKNMYSEFRDLEAKNRKSHYDTVKVQSIRKEKGIHLPKNVFSQTY